MRSIGKKSQQLALAGALSLAVFAGGCSSIKDNRGYIQNQMLVGSVQPGIDNRLSVAQTLGRPSFVSQFGEPTWYYVTSQTGQSAFNTPKIRSHSVLAVKFDAAGNVIATDISGMNQVASVNPDGDKTPTLGRERGFLEDLFGNIGSVGGLPGQGAGTP